MDRFRIKVNTIGDIGLLFYLCASFSHCSGAGLDHLLTLGSFGLLCGFIAIKALRNNFCFDGYCWYVCAYIAVLCCSYFWAEWPEYVFSSSSNLLNDAIQFFVFSVFLANRVKTRDDVNHALKIFMISVVYMLISIIIRTPARYYSNSMEQGLRVGTVTGLWVTDIAVIYSIGIAIYLYFFKNGKYRNIVCLGVLGLCFVYLLLTGSKQGLLFVFIFVALYTVLNKNKNSLKKAGFIIGIGISVFIIYQLLLNIPFLYSAFGARLQSFVDGLSTGTADSSTNTRSELMMMAFYLFSQRPILGWGYYSVTAYTAHIGYFISTFAHSAYLETAADLGLLGLIIIYSMHCNVLVRLFINRKQWDSLDVFLFAIILALILLDVMNVSFMWISIYFIIQMGYIANEFRGNKNEKAYLDNYDVNV